jgi:hypothetical protein
MCVRPVCKDAPEDEILDPNIEFRNPDAWFIYAAAGEMVQCLKAEPFPLPYFGWQKRNKVRFWPRERLIHAIRASSSNLLSGPVS